MAGNTIAIVRSVKEERRQRAVKSAYHFTILSLKKTLKKWAKAQAKVRAAKLQKSQHDQMEITVLHRIYLILRGKDPESHKVREGYERIAKQFEEDYYRRFFYQMVSNNKIVREEKE